MSVPVAPDSTLPVIRRARAADAERVGELLYGDPSREMAAIIGGRERALAMGRALHRYGIGRAPGEETWLAELGGRPVGLLIARVGGVAEGDAVLRSARLVGWTLRNVPLREVPALVRRARMRARLDFATAADAYHVRELQVSPPCRGHGIGAALLAHAEREARAAGCPRMSLTTLSNNPARSLYLRAGYAVVAERTVQGYEALTGSAGRVYLEKALFPAGAHPGTASDR